ncbi:MAG: lipopolysaccharide biosynthesis protein [Nostoc sp.]
MYILRKINILEKVSPGSSRSLFWEIINSALIFLASILINRSLGAQDRGLFTLVILIPTTMFTIAGCQWDRTLKSLIIRKKISGKEAWRRSVYYTIFLSPIFIPLTIISNFIYTNLNVEVKILIFIYSCIFPIYLMAGFLYAIYLSTGSIDGQYRMRTSMQISYVLLVFISSYFKLISVHFLILIYIVLQIIYFISGWIQKEKLLYGSELLEKPSLIPLMKGFLPNTIETLSLNLDIWLLSYFGSLITLGHYVAMNSLMQPINLISNALINGSTARLNWSESLVVRRYLLRTTYLMFFLLFFSIIMIFIINPYVLESLLGKSFVSAWWMIPWITGVVITKATATQFQTAIQLSGLENAYLTMQSLEPVSRLLIVGFLGWQFSELGIFLGLILSSLLKILGCLLIHIKLTN